MCNALECALQHSRFLAFATEQDSQRLVYGHLICQRTSGNELGREGTLRSLSLAAESIQMCPASSQVTNCMARYLMRWVMLAVCLYSRSIIVHSPWANMHSLHVADRWVVHQCCGLCRLADPDHSSCHRLCAAAKRAKAALHAFTFVPL